MADECAKAVARRKGDSRWRTYLSGDGIDIGAGGDGLSKYRHSFPAIESVRDWDWPDGDAQYMASVDNSVYDFVHSSHCLEHMRDAGIALSNWWRILKPGGHLIVVVPDWDLYEHRVWPSWFNQDHKLSFTLVPQSDPRILNLHDLVSGLPGAVVEQAETLEHTVPAFMSRGEDWSIPAKSEPAIEVVVKKVLRT